MTMNPFHFLLLLSLPLLFHLSLSLDFAFNGFNSSELLLLGNATVSSRVLTLTNNTAFSIGLALYKARIPVKSPGSSHVYPFSTSFIFAMAPYRKVLPGHGFVFIFAPATGIEGAATAQNLGFINRTLDGVPSNHLFGIEFDVFRNEEYADIDDNHVGIDVYSLKSTSSHAAGYWPDHGPTNEKSFRPLKLNNGRNYQAWIDYSDSVLNVTMAPVGMKRPNRALLNVSLNLSEVFLDEMYIGFTAATGQLVQGHNILAWSFSNSNFSLSERLITSGLPSFVLPGSSVFKSRGFVAGISAGSFLVVNLGLFYYLFVVRRRKFKGKVDLEEWEMEYWPHRIGYEEIEAATKGFSEENVIGVGGNGKVYKGVLPRGVEIAVKRVLPENGDGGMRAFLAEVSSLGRLKHRNLVGLRGWCMGQNGNFMLVYDYMENGSLEKRVFDNCGDESKVLSCKDRVRILKDVACGILYLHEGWEAKVIHRDIKASNVLLDRDMNGRLGDFGLARMHDHGTPAWTTRVVGTVGYLAPEVVRTGKASAKSDVFSFGVLVLEVMCGRRPAEDGLPGLVDWVRDLATDGKVRGLMDAVDGRIRARGDFDPEEALRAVQLGLVCANPDPTARPTMRQAVKFLEGKSEASGEPDSEDMDVYLLRVTGPGALWSSNGHGPHHPTLEEIRQSISSSMSLSWSNSLNEGR